MRKALVQLQLHGVIRRVAGAVRREGIIFLVKVAILRKWPQKLIDVSTERRIRQFDSRGDSLRASVVGKAGGVHRQLAAK